MTSEDCLPILKGYDKNSPTDSLTGGQIQSMLDLLILESLAPIIRNSDVFDIQLVHLLSVTARNRKRRLSALPREELINELCQALAVNDRARKIEIISQAKIERGFLYKFVVNFLRQCSGYERLYYEYLTESSPKKRESLHLRLRSTEKALGFSRDRLYSSIQASTDYLELMYEFRNVIVGNYIRFAYQQAKMYVSKKGSNFNFNDVYQNFLVIITKAIDKYDASKGPLTSYVKWWILNAQTANNSDHGHEYGIAYTLPQMQKKSMATNGVSDGQVNFSISLNKLVGKDGDETEFGSSLKGSEGVEHELERKQELDQIRYLVKKADIRGMARLSLEIDEFFSAKELNQMREVMRTQLGVTV